MNGFERLSAMMTGKPVDHLPVMPITMMFAADQIGRPYGQYAADYRTLVEGQLRTAEKFGLDHVSAISDPAREAADCGANVHYFDDQPPAIDEGDALLSKPQALARLKIPDPLGGGRMHERVKAIAEFRRKVGGQLLIEGWVEGPCAESSDLRGINSLMMDFIDDEKFVQDLFLLCTEMAEQFAAAQIAFGADIVSIGDAAASLVGPEICQKFVFPAEKRLVDFIHRKGANVRLHICGNITAILPQMHDLGCDIIDLGYPVSVRAARAAMGAKQVLLGNLDPVREVRNSTPDAIAAALGACFAEAGPNYIVAAGCEIPRDTAADNFAAFSKFAGSNKPARGH